MAQPTQLDLFDTPPSPTPDPHWDEDRMDIISQNGPTGEHYNELYPNLTETESA